MTETRNKNKSPSIYDITKDLTIPILSLLLAIVLGIQQLCSWIDDQKNIVMPRSGWLPKIINKELPFNIEIVNVGKTDIHYILEVESSFSTITSQDTEEQDSATYNSGKFSSYKIFLGSKDSTLNSYTHNLKSVINTSKKPQDYNDYNENDFSSNAYIYLKIKDASSRKVLYESKCYYIIHENKDKSFTAIFNRPQIDTTSKSDDQYKNCNSL